MDPQNIPQTQPSTPDANKPSVGPAIGIIIIILVVVLGGLYFWGQRIAKENMGQLDTASEQNEAELRNIEEQSSSDDIESINADIEATQSASLGSEMDEIEGAANSSDTQ